MRSAAQAAYAQAQAAIDGRPDDATGPLLGPILEPLYAAYRALKRARDDRAAARSRPAGAQARARPPTGTVDRVITPERLDSHRLIEEFMILANVAAAETLEQARAAAHLPRARRAGSRTGQMRCASSCRPSTSRCRKAGALRPAQFNGILERVKGREVEKLVNDVVLRTQAQAEYAAENYGHFGLNLRRYAHFTSPIRRYADLVVHRALIRALDLDGTVYPSRWTQASLGEISARFRPPNAAP